MSYVSLFFDPSINWKSSYRRNNKTTQNKHILCFPDHINFKHRSTGFCGQSIRIKVYNNCNDTLFVCGHFSYYLSPNEIDVGTIIPITYFDENDRMEAPFYFGKSNDSRNEFVLNERYKAWMFNLKWPKKESQYCFNVFGMIYDSNINCYKCVCRISSPPFALTSSRNQQRKNKEKENKSSMKLLTIPPPLSLKITSNSSIILSPLLAKYFPFIKRGIEDIINKIDKDLPNYLSKLPNYKSDDNIVIKYKDDNRKVEKIMKCENCMQALLEFLESKPEQTYRQYDLYKFICSSPEEKYNYYKTMISMDIKSEKYFRKYDGVSWNMRHVSDINVSAEREELSFVGDSIPSFISKYNNNMYYLDKYGNKCKMPQICLLEYLQVHQLIN